MLDGRIAGHVSPLAWEEDKDGMSSSLASIGQNRVERESFH